MQSKIEKENKIIKDNSQLIAKLYDLKPSESLRDITEEVYSYPETKQHSKEAIRQFNRKIYLFEYPSDGLKVKGFISFTHSKEKQPLLILLRGGNREWGLINPGIDFAVYENMTVLSTTYRGGVSEGSDEFGGDDVNDVKNLVEFIPTLQNNLSFPSIEKMFMLGMSRGGMEMFLTLARYPSIQKSIDKIVSLSGLLNLELQIQHRHDMKEMFIKDFGLIEGHENSWINKRNPILMASFIDKSLPILIVQGTLDNRVSLEEGRIMTKTLQKHGNRVSYMELEGDHCLKSLQNRTNLVFDWLVNN